MKLLLFQSSGNMVVFDVSHNLKVGISRKALCDGCQETKPCYIIETFAPTICKECLSQMFQIAAAHFEPGPSRPPE